MAQNRLVRRNVHVHVKCIDHVDRMSARPRRLDDAPMRVETGIAGEHDEVHSRKVLTLKIYGLDGLASFPAVENVLMGASVVAPARIPLKSDHKPVLAATRTIGQSPDAAVGTNTNTPVPACER